MFPHIAELSASLFLFSQLLKDISNCGGSRQGRLRKSQVQQLNTLSISFIFISF